MEKTEFTHRLYEAKKSLPHTNFNYEELKNLCKQSIEKSPDIEPKPGTRNLIIAMEELNELSQQVSKFVRGRGDYICLVEEIADVLLVMEYIYSCCGIDEKDVVAALEVKKNFLKERLDKGCY